jgi:SAM-dependent methyltransferase
LAYDQEGRYKFERFLDKLLGDKSYISNRLELFNLYVNITGERLKTAPKYYKNGGIAEEYSPERSEIVANSSKSLNVMFPILIKQLPEDNGILKTLEQGTKFLDIGCGSGILIIQLAEIFQNSKFVGIDHINQGIKTAQKKIQGLGLEDRVSVKCLGGQDLQYTNEFGLISMVITLHEIIPDIRYNLLEKGFQALKKEGQLIIFDISYPDNMEDFRNQNYEMGIVEQFNETSLGVQLLTSHEQDEMLIKVGFKDIQRHTFEGLDIISAKK